MSEPVIPERWKDKYAYPFTYGSKAFRQLVEELGAAEAKVAELERTTSNLRLELKAIRDSSAVNLSDSISERAEQATTIERLTRALENAQALHPCPMYAAALSKQEPK